MQDGWIKLHRCLLDKPIWTKATLEQKVLLTTILLSANHKPKEWEWQGNKFICNPGQFITSLDSLAKKAGVSIQNVRTALARFEKLEFLTNQSTKTGRLITVVNWAFYQAESKEPNREDNKDLTKTQQRPNKDLTTNKNDKNDKNDKNEKNEKKLYGEFIFLTEKEYQKLSDDFGIDLKRMLDILDNYLGQSDKNRKKYTSHNHVLRGWVKDRLFEEKAKSQPAGKNKADLIDKYLGLEA